jgi:hypothetical protein
VHHHVTAFVLSVPYVLLAVLTTIGSCRRGVSVGPSVLCGLVFPVTWVAWYVRDGGLSGWSADGQKNSSISR